MKMHYFLAKLMKFSKGQFLSSGSRALFFSVSVPADLRLYWTLGQFHFVLFIEQINYLMQVARGIKIILSGYSNHAIRQVILRVHKGILKYTFAS